MRGSGPGLWALCSVSQGEFLDSCDGLPDVFEDGSFSGQDVECCGHAGQEGDGLSVFQGDGAFDGDVDQVMGLVGFLVLDGIGADPYDTSVDGAVAGRIVGGETDPHQVVDADLGNIGGLDLSLDDQVVLCGNQFDHHVSAVHVAARCAEIELIDDPGHRCPNHCPADTLFQ